MGKSRIPYLRELKTVSKTLSQQTSWKEYPYKDIFRSVAVLALGYTMQLDDYIRQSGKYGCPIREKVFTDIAVNKMMQGDKWVRPIDVYLAEKILSHRQYPEKYSKEEGSCYRRVRLLAEARANYFDIECTILNQEPYDPATEGWKQKNQIDIFVKKPNSDEVDIFAYARLLGRPASMTYIEGMTENTVELYYILMNYHKQQQHRPTA